MQIDIGVELSTDIDGRIRIREEGKRLMGCGIGDFQLVIVWSVGERRWELLPEILGEHVEGITGFRATYYDNTFAKQISILNFHRIYSIAPLYDAKKIDICHRFWV